MLQPITAENVLTHGVC